MFQCTFGKAVRSCCGGKSGRTSDNNAVCAAAAMDDQEVSICILTAGDTNVYVCRIKYEVAQLRVAP